MVNRVEIREKSSSIKGEDLIDLLPAGHRRFINTSREYRMTVRPAHELFVSNRFDVAAKYAYANAYLEGHVPGWIRDLYCAHIQAFNAFYEADGSGKIGRDAFLRSFNELIDSVQAYGFDPSRPIPLSGGVMLDGAHRVSVAMALGQEVPVIEMQGPIHSFNYTYFQSRGMSESNLDFMAMMYSCVHSGARFALIWPAATGKQQEIIDILQKRGGIAYHKDVYLSELGMLNLMRLVYRNEPWLGSLRDNFAGASNKAQWCSKKGAPVRVFLLLKVKDWVALKEEIRQVFGLEKHSVHINDSEAETIQLAQAMLNANGVHLLNHQQIYPVPWYHRLLSDFSGMARSANIPLESLCLTGSATLALYGIRDVRDLDFISSHPQPLKTCVREIDCHNEEFEREGLLVEDVIHNPEKHVYADGVKHVSLELLVGLKSRRAESKDKADLEAVDRLLSGRSANGHVIVRIRRALTFDFLKAQLKLLALKIRYRVCMWRRPKT